MSGKTRSLAPGYFLFVKRAGKQERKLAPGCTKKRSLVTDRLEPNTRARVNNQRSFVRKLKLLKFFFFLQADAKHTIDCAQFMAWLSAEPQSIVWLPTLHRLAASEAGKLP